MNTSHIPIPGAALRAFNSAYPGSMFEKPDGDFVQCDDPESLAAEMLENVALLRSRAEDLEAALAGEKALNAELLAALEELSARASEAKAELDAGIPEGEPVHPVSARLTWPISTALLAIDKATRRTS